MKKFIVISLFMLICISSLFAQDVLVQYWAGDASYNFVSFVGPDLNPAVDGWTLEFYVSGDAVIDGLDPVTRLPLGDDLLAVNQENGYFMDALNGGMFTGAAGQWYASVPVQTSDPVGSPPEPVINLGDYFYIVLYNDPDPVVGATHYCTSEMVTAEADGGPHNIGIPVWSDDNWIPFGEDPLPVTLTTFSAAVFANEFVEISWTTETESGNQGFNIYRGSTNEFTSSVQLNYDLIPGAGSSTEPVDYSYMDEGVEDNATYWYWLESVSNDETTIYEPTTLTVEFTEDPTPEIPEATELIGNHPNPFNPLTEINFNVKEGETATLTIYDIKGRVVETATYGQGVQSYTWEANSSASGVYFYKLESPSYTNVKKMMLLK